MPPEPIELGGRRAFVLEFEPETTGLPSFEGAADVTYVTRDFADARFDEGAIAIVHSLWSARVLPVLAAARAGVRTFHLVDAPGSSFASNARGAVAVAARRALARIVARSPFAPLAERVIGRLDVPWPSSAASARVVDAAVAAPPSAGAAGRVVHWLPAFDDEPLARLELLVPALRARGVAVDVLSPAPIDGHEAARVRRVEKLGATWRFLAARSCTASDRPRLGGLAPALVADIERHVRADALVPLLEALLERGPAIVHAWTSDLASVALAGVAALLARAPRVVLRASASDDPALRRLAARPEVALSAALPLVAPVATLEPAERATRRKLLGAPELFVAVAGDLDERAARTLVAVAKSVPTARVVHVGRADAAARLAVREAGVAPTLAGAAPDRDEYLRLADVAVLLDRSDALRARARALGAAVVAAGPSDDGLVGFDDAESAAREVARLARDEPARRALAERGLAVARERFAPERFVKAVLELYGV